MAYAIPAMAATAKAVEVRIFEDIAYDSPVGCSSESNVFAVM